MTDAERRALEAEGFTVEERPKLVEVVAPLNRLFTIGYRGIKRDALLQKIVELNAWLADVRYMPWSRAFPDFNQDVLRRAAGERYRHVRAFGNLKYRSATEIELYDPERGVLQVKMLLQVRPVVLMCMCAEPLECHRETAAQLCQEKLGVDIVRLTWRDLRPDALVWGERRQVEQAANPQEDLFGKT